MAQGSASDLNQHVNEHVQAPRVSDFAELSPNYQTRRSSLEQLEEQLKLLGTSSSTEQILRLGEIVHRVLRAEDGARSETSQKASLRRIAALPGVPFKVTTLWRAVSVYEMSLRMPHLLAVKGLGISHLRAVIGLDPSDQELLLTQAAKKDWTKRQLENEVARLRAGRRRRGRRPLPKLTLWARELTRLLERSADVGDHLDEVTEATRVELVHLLGEIETKGRALREKLEGSAREARETGMT